MKNETKTAIQDVALIIHFAISFSGKEQRHFTIDQIINCFRKQSENNSISDRGIREICESLYENGIFTNQHSQEGNKNEFYYLSFDVQNPTWVVAE